MSENTNAREMVRDATDYVSKITPSVIALATVVGVNVDKFAAVLADQDAQADFLVALTSAYIKEQQKSNKKKNATKAKSE